MKILVLGASGMLGSAAVRLLRERGHEVTAITRREYDIAALPTLEMLPLTGQDAVINCAGIINRRTDSVPTEISYIVNSLFPRLLADACEALEVKLVHISTDCVFDGAEGQYDETSPPTATSLYGRSKLLGEPANAMVLRTSIIGAESTNFYSLLCWFLAQQGECQGYTNHWWNGITTLELVRVVAEILERGLWQKGLRHIHGEDITKYALLEKIAAAFGKTIRIVPTATEHPHDMRLRTQHKDFLVNLNIAALDTQLATLRRYCDEQGHMEVGQKADPALSVAKPPPIAERRSAEQGHQRSHRYE